jgi:carboxyl-terminal processing protease
MCHCGEDDALSRLLRLGLPRALACTILAIGLLVAVADAGSSVALSPVERAKIFEQVWKLINEKYYDASFNAVDWKQIHDRYRPRLTEIRSDKDFYDLLKQMTGELHDAHTRFRSPDERRRANDFESVNPGLGIGEVDGKPVVISVEPESEAERAGIEPGMIISAVNGMAFAQEVARAKAEVGDSSSGRATTLLSYYWLLSGDPDTSIRIGLVRPDGSHLDAVLTRRVVGQGPALLPKPLPSGYTYLRLPVFDEETTKQLKAALAKNKSARGLILDLRGNPGGDFHALLNAANYFFPEKVSFGKVIARSGKKPSLILRMLGVPADLNVGDAGESAYTGPVVILVNEGSASAAELFAAGMQENGRAAIVGRQTCGCLLASVHHKVKGGGEVDISEFNVLTAKGRRLEGVGVLPDVTVPLTMEDLRERHDATLRQAVAILHTSSGRRAER